jgi:hypothetical protein
VPASPVPEPKGLFYSGSTQRSTAAGVIWGKWRNQRTFAALAALHSPGGAAGHVSLEFNIGHPGVPESHYHIVLWHVPKAQERPVKK